MKTYLGGMERKLPNNFKLYFLGNRIQAVYSHQTKRPKNQVFVSKVDPILPDSSLLNTCVVYEITRVNTKINTKSNGVNTFIRRKYVDYAININLLKLKENDDILQIISDSYYALKRAAMIDSRIYKITELETKLVNVKYIKQKEKINTKLSKLQEELKYLENLKSGKPFGAYIFTDKYKFEVEMLSNPNRPHLYDPNNLPF